MSKKKLFDQFALATAGIALSTTLNIAQAQDSPAPAPAASAPATTQVTTKELPGRQSWSQAIPADCKPTVDNAVGAFSGGAVEKLLSKSLGRHIVGADKLAGRITEAAIKDDAACARIPNSTTVNAVSNTVPASAAFELKN